jgi:predicted RNase H-like nuclease (RuvC/YqgF family)
MSDYPWHVRDAIDAATRDCAKVYQVDALRGDVDRLERSLRETSAVVDGLRNELTAAQDQIREHLGMMQTLLDLHKMSSAS